MLYDISKAENNMLHNIITPLFIFTKISAIMFQNNDGQTNSSSGEQLV